MEIQDFISLLKIWIKEEVIAQIQAEGNTIVLYFSDGKQRKITVE